MWSTVNEQITDGTSGLLPNSSPIALVVGASSKRTPKPITIGKHSDIHEIFGIGEMPRRLKDTQTTMADCSLIAISSESDIPGTISAIQTNRQDTLTIVGNATASTQIFLEVKSAGILSKANLSIKISGDIQFQEEGINIQDGIYEISELGIVLMFSEDIEFQMNDSWSFSTQAPISSYQALEKSISKALELYTPEFVFVAQDIDVDSAKLFGILADKLFEDHKPCFFLLETTLNSSQNIDTAVALKKEEFASVSSRFVSIVCQDGFIRTSNGLERRSPSGLCAGHITKAHVNQSIGATNSFAVSQYELPSEWTNVHSRSLDEAKFITLRTYAGLDNLFWSNGRTFADDKSDYRFIEIVRTVFKAIRLARRAALPYIQSPGDEAGIQNLIAEIRTVITSMVESLPKELDHFNVSAPENQDITNNGILLNIELFGIPVIRKIQLNFLYKYQQN